jgi:uncharacterized membrane protein (UPF0127 family)
MRRLIFILLLSFFSLAYAKEVTQRVCIKNTCITAEIADDDYKRQQGLMFRESLTDDRGMLFVFQVEDKYSFWMKNMLIPLDIIWISRDLRIVDISTNVKPCAGACENIIPKQAVKYVLEVKSGFVSKHKLNLGDQVFLDTKGPRI